MNRARIIPARLPDDLPMVRSLFGEYANSLGVALDFQGFETELAELPGKYAIPEGAILLALHGGNVVGCVAMRPLGDGVCEMKRMYLCPAARGLHMGQALAQAIIDAAQAAGHRRMVLDTFDRLTAARGLYVRLGFSEVAPYYNNPLPGVIYMGRDL